MKKLIELWKTDCSDCEAAKPIIAKLEREEYTFEKHNIQDQIGRGIWEEYLSEIDENSRNQGYDEGYIYTPTFINPKTRKVLAFADRSPTREELIDLSKGGKEK